MTDAAQAQETAGAKKGLGSNAAARASGARDAAILMLAVGEEKAAIMFSHLDDYEIRDISREMANIGKVNAAEVEEVLNRFSDAIGGGASGIMGGWKTTERFLKQVMDPGKVNDIMEEMRGPEGRTMWEKLSNVSEDILANYLKNEYPQTVAVIISRIRPAHAARVIAALPEDFAMEVMERILLMDNVSREVIETVEESLRNEFMRNLATKQKRDSHELMAEIFNSFDRANETKFLELLESRSEEDAQKIRALMFTFEDLLKTDDLGIQAIMRDVEKDKLALCLKGASDELKEFFMRNMSERAAKILAEDMEAMGPVRVKDVDEAQGEVVIMAKKLVDEGKIMIMSEGDDSEFI